jgi:hypothetical protein
MGKKSRTKKPKKLTFLDIYNSIRQVWEINPKTRVKPNKKKYNRAKTKREFKKELDS